MRNLLKPFIAVIGGLLAAVLLIAPVSVLRAAPLRYNWADLGFPRVTTTVRDAIGGNALHAGLCVYNTTTSFVNCYTGSSWKVIPEATSVGLTPPTSATPTCATGYEGSIFVLPYANGVNDTALAVCSKDDNDDLFKWKNLFTGEFATTTAVTSPNTLLAKKTARAVFDPSTNAGDRTVAAHVFGPFIPDNALVTYCFYRVITTFTSATDAGTVSMGVNSDAAAGIKTAVAISDGSNPYDAGNFATIPTGVASTFVTQTTAARQFVATVAVEALTAGKLILFCDYVITE